MTLKFQTFDGSQAPTLAPLGKARAYFDQATNLLMLSQNGGAYAPLGGGATVAGSNGQVQFANAGGTALAASTDFVWDNTLKALGLGMAALNRLGVSAFNATLPAPTALVITPVVETVALPAVVTGVTQLNGPDNALGASGAINDPDGSGIFTSDGSDWTFNLWGTQTVNGTSYVSDTAQSFDMGTDPNDGNPISFTLNWTAGASGDGYVYELYQNGSLVFTGVVAGIGATSTTINNTSVPGSRGPAFGSIAYPFIAPGTLPPPIVSAGPPFAQYGSGPYTANGSTYAYTMDSLTTIEGVAYPSGSPVSAGSFSDDNSSNPFYVEIDWSSGGGDTDNTVVQGQINGGGFFYFFGGSSGIANDMSGGSNDPDAQAAWFRTYGGPVAITHNYDLFGLITSPGAYYSAGSNGFVYPAFNSPTGYVLFIAIDYAGATALQKLLGGASGNETNSTVIATSPILDTPSLWGGDNTVTPKHIGLAGDGSTYAFQLYGRITSPATLYSVTHADAAVTLPNDGVFRYLNINWTTAVGATTTKILRSINGGGFTSGYQSGFMQGLLQYFNTTTFGDGTVVTPNTATDIAALFQNSASGVSDAAQVRLKSTGGSAAKIEFVNSSDAFCASMGIEPGTIRTQFKSPVGLWDFLVGTTVYNSIGATNTVFNSPNAGSYTFRINGQSGDLFTAFSSGNSIAIGAASNIGAGTLTVEPRDDRNAFYIKAFGGGNPANHSFIVGVFGDNTAGFEFTRRGHLTIRGAGENARINVAAGDTSFASLFLTPGTLTTSPINGDIEHDNSAFYLTQSGGRFRVMVGPQAGLTNTFFPMADGNGNLSDNGLRNNAGTFIIQGPITLVEFKVDAVWDSGKNIQLNGAGQLQTGNGGALVAGTGTGWKFGTAANQKMGFWNVAPVVQPATTGTALGFVANAGTAVNDASTFTGGSGTKAYRISDVVKALKDMGLMAAS